MTTVLNKKRTGDYIRLINQAVPDDHKPHVADIISEIENKRKISDLSDKALTILRESMSLLIENMKTKSEELCETDNRNDGKLSARLFLKATSIEYAIMPIRAEIQNRSCSGARKKLIDAMVDALNEDDDVVTTEWAVSNNPKLVERALSSQYLAVKSALNYGTSLPVFLTEITRCMGIMSPKSLMCHELRVAMRHTTFVGHPSELV
jgi:hypothetical protein